MNPHNTICPPVSPRKQLESVSLFTEGTPVPRDLFALVNDNRIELSPKLLVRDFVEGTEVKDFEYHTWPSGNHSLYLPRGVTNYFRDEPGPHSASEILETGRETLNQRAKLRDSESTGERSMARAVAIFNAWQGENGDHLTEEEGWRFMIALKQARMVGGKFHMDDYVDLASYSALLGEHLGDINARSPKA